MKTLRSLFSPAFIIIIILSLFSCKHKAETVITSYSPLVGQWKGTTFQNRPVTISVGDVNAKPFITSYDFYVKSDSVANPDSVLHLTRTSTNGMGPVVSYRFSVPIAHVNADLENIGGKFDSATITLAGNIVVIFKTPPDTVRETFTASKQK